MELKIKPSPGNQFALKGLFIRNSSAAACIKEIQSIRLSMHDIRIFPVPGKIADSIGGYLIISKNKLNAASAGKNELYQMVSSNLYIPERSVMHPLLMPAEIEKLFSSSVHIIHPELGIAELNEELQLAKLLLAPKMRSYYVTRPEATIFIPKQIKSFQIKPVSSEEILKNLEQNVFPQKETFKDKPLSLLEKGKLNIYKLLFTKKKEDSIDKPFSIGKTGLGARFFSTMDSLFKNNTPLEDNLQQDYEDLEKRNQKEIDKLMELFRTNPEEALKYAIPLDEKGSNRGGMNQSFSLSKRWFDFSLSGNYNNSGGGNVDLGDHYNDLHKQYNATALAFIDKKEYHRAAFVYMKLLKNHHLAAQALETGKFYQEAATIYLKHLNNKTKAAECYEKGNMIKEAIDLYSELQQNEKVGDLYVSINKKKEADIYYDKVVENYKSKNQYVKASLVYKNKINKPEAGQSLLMEGWKNNKDASNCLNNYFSNISDIKTLKHEIENIYKHHLTPQNSTFFLQVIRLEFDKKNELADSIKEIAYEVIAANIDRDPSIVSELKSFNKKDKELLKDTLRFKVGKNKY
jgi:hypothetical protein